MDNQPTRPDGKMIDALKARGASAPTPTRLEIQLARAVMVLVDGTYGHCSLQDKSYREAGVDLCEIARVAETDLDDE